MFNLNIALVGGYIVNFISIWFIPGTFAI